MNLSLLPIDPDVLKNILVRSNPKVVHGLIEAVKLPPGNKLIELSEEALERDARKKVSLKEKRGYMQRQRQRQVLMLLQDATPRKLTALQIYRRMNCMAQSTLNECLTAMRANRAIECQPGAGVLKAMNRVYWYDNKLTT